MSHLVVDTPKGWDNFQIPQNEWLCKEVVKFILLLLYFRAVVLRCVLVVQGRRKLIFTGSVASYLDWDRGLKNKFLR